MTVIVKHRKICKLCGERKILSPENFHRKKSSKDGFQSRCKSCKQASVLKWQAENQESYLAAQRKKSNPYREELIAYKENNPCADCGVYLPYYAMDLDHLPGHEKSDDVSKLSMGRGPERHTRLWAEIAKCELVCASCHRIRTHLRQFGEPQAA